MECEGEISLSMPPTPLNVATSQLSGGNKKRQKSQDTNM